MSRRRRAGPPVGTLTFEDLAGSNRVPSDEEDQWLQQHVASLDPGSFVVSLPGARALADDDEHLPLVERRPDGTWRAGRWVGELRIAGRPLRIVPRLGYPVLAGWLAAAVNVPVLPRAAGVHGSSEVIPQLLAAVWVALVADAARHARPGLRTERRDNARVVRGRIDVRGTTRLRSRGAQDRVATVERPRTLDHDLSRVIVRADRTLDRLLSGTSPEWRSSRLVRELVAELVDTVGAHPELPSRRALDRIRYTPILAGYRDAARLSHSIARHQGLTATADAHDASGVLLDVAEVWELFLTHCARAAFGPGQVEHAARSTAPHHLLSSERDGSTLGRIRPDIVISGHSGTRLVLDAKYKRLVQSKWRPDGVDRADLYQLTSYLAAEPVGTPGALLYPPDDSHASAPAEALGPWRTVGGQRMSMQRIGPSATDVVCALQALAEEPSATLPTAREVRRASVA